MNQVIHVAHFVSRSVVRERTTISRLIRSNIVDMIELTISRDSYKQLQFERAHSQLAFLILIKIFAKHTRCWQSRGVVTFRVQSDSELRVEVLEP